MVEFSRKVVITGPVMPRCTGIAGSQVRFLPAGPPRGGGGQGGILPRAPIARGPKKFVVGPLSFFWVKYFRAKGKIFVFWGKVPKFGREN